MGTGQPRLSNRRRAVAVGTALAGLLLVHPAGAGAEPETASIRQEGLTAHPYGGMSCMSPCRLAFSAHGAGDPDHPSGPFTYEWDFDGPNPELGPSDFYPVPPKLWSGALQKPFTVDAVGQRADYTYRYRLPAEGLDYVPTTTLRVRSPDGAIGYQFAFFSMRPHVSYAGPTTLRLPETVEVKAETPGTMMTWRSDIVRGPLGGLVSGSAGLGPMGIAPERRGPDADGYYHFTYHLKRATFGPITLSPGGFVGWGTGTVESAGYLEPVKATVVENRTPHYTGFRSSLRLRATRPRGGGGRACRISAGLTYEALRRARHRVVVEVQRRGKGRRSKWRRAARAVGAGGIAANLSPRFRPGASIDLQRKALARRIERTRGLRWRAVGTYVVRGSKGERVYRKRRARPLVRAVGPHTCGKRR